MSPILPDPLSPALLERVMRAAKLRQQSPRAVCCLVANLLADHEVDVKVLSRTARFESLEHPNPNTSENAARFIKEQEQLVLQVGSHLLDPVAPLHGLHACTWSHILARFHRAMADPPDGYPTRSVFASPAKVLYDTPPGRQLGAHRSPELETLRAYLREYAAQPIPTRLARQVGAAAVVDPFAVLPSLPPLLETREVGQFQDAIGLPGLDALGVDIFSVLAHVPGAQLRIRQASLRKHNLELTASQHFVKCDSIEPLIALHRDNPWRAPVLRCDPYPRGATPDWPIAGAVQWEKETVEWKTIPVSPPTDADRLTAAARAAVSALQAVALAAPSANTSLPTVRARRI